MPLVTWWINGRVGPGLRGSDPKTTALSIVACPDLMGGPWGRLTDSPGTSNSSIQISSTENCNYGAWDSLDKGEISVV